MLQQPAPTLLRARPQTA